MRFLHLYISITLIAIANISISQTIILKGDDNYPPYDYMDVNGNPDGFSIALLKEIEKVSDLIIQVNSEPWHLIKEQLISNKIDCITGMYNTPERRKHFLFSVSFCEITQSAFVRSDSEIHTPKQLRDQEIVVVQDDVMHEYLINNKISTCIIATQNTEEALELLSSGVGDAALLPKIQCAYFCKKNKITNLTEVPLPIQPFKYCFAVNKSNQHSLTKLNEGLWILKLNGIYDELYLEWFGVYETNSFLQQHHRKLFTLLAWTLCCALLIGVWIKSLKSNVKRITKDLKKTEDQFKSLFTNMQDAAVYYRVNKINDKIIDFEFVSVNDSWEQLMGISKDLVLGKSFYEIYALYTEIRFPVLNTCYKVLEDHIPRKTKFYSEKNDKWFSASVYEPNTGYLAIILNDISKETKYIEELKNAELKLRKALEKAEESDSLKSAFLANISHEIRTPMNAILGFSGLMNQHDLEEKKSKEYIKIINRKAKELLRIINDIIDFSMIEADQFRIQETSVSLENIMTDAEFVINEELRKQSKTNIEVAINYDKTTITTDALRLNQVIYNLGVNAVKNTVSGKIEFGYNLIGNKFVQFYIKDTGIGIPVDKHSVIFERFRQIDNSLNNKGNGLGLSICKGIIEKMNGRIWVDSKIGGPTCFYFTIPHKSTTNPDNLAHEAPDTKAYVVQSNQ